MLLCGAIVSAYGPVFSFLFLILTLTSALRSHGPSLVLNTSHSNPPSGVHFMHYHLDTTASTPSSLTVSKRARARFMNQCTGTGRQRWAFTKSNCSRRQNLRNLILYCEHQGYVKLIEQSCAAEELCIDTGNAAWDTKAYCVKMDDFFQVPASERQRVRAQFQANIPLHRSNALAANALLVDRSRTRGFSGVTSFGLAALGQRDPTEGEAEAGQAVLDSVDCVGCYELALKHLPDEASLLRVMLDIKGAEAGYLYLTTVS